MPLQITTTLLVLGLHIFKCRSFSETPDIPQFVYDTCMYADICDRKATMQPPPGQASCCSSCSCAEDCGLHLDCCFDQLDKYKLIEKGVVACVQPVMQNSKLIDNHRRTPHFYMVTACSFLNTSAADFNACDWTDADNATLVAPVTDVRTNLTFINENCAKCNNINTYVKWNYFFTTPFMSGSNHGSTMWALETSVGNKIGVNFYVPSEDIAKATKSCYPTFGNADCEASSPIYDICESLNLPYRLISYTELIFKNIACFKCKTNVLPSDPSQQTCPDNKRYNRYFYANSKLTVLINVKVQEAAMKSLSKSSDIPHGTSDNKCPPWTVQSQIENRCLPIHCPEGMIRVVNECKYVFVYWHASVVMLQVKLVPSPGTLLPVSILKSLSSEKLKNVYKWMTVPCLKLKPLQYEIHYENASLENVRSLIVNLRKLPSFEEFSPSTYVPLLEKCIKEPWYLHFGKTKYKFIPELDAYFDYVADGRTKINWFYAMVEYIRPKLYDALKLLPGLETHRGPLTVAKKTFFCRQVWLPINEVEVGVAQVHILATNKTLGNNEFYLNDASNIGSARQQNASVSICIEDYIMNSGTDEKYAEDICLPILIACVVLNAFDMFML